MPIYDMKNKIDLHIHTTKSDGTKTPKEVLIEAEQLGLSRIAITDHESIEAYDEIKENKNLFRGIIIPGIELKTYCQGREIELLGYGISLEDMKRKLPLLYQSKEEINKEYLKAIIDVLTKEGIIISKSVEKQYMETTVQPAKFITKIILDDKINLEHNTNILFLDNIKHKNNESLYRGWLSNPKSRFYVNFKGYPDYEEAIELIQKSRGKVFIPHIFQYADASQEILEKLLQSGKIDGIECYYPTFTKEQTQYLLELCTKKHIFVSGGSDYHGANKKNELGRGIGNNLYVPEEKVLIWTNMLYNREEKVKKDREDFII